jgi:hypothetical protein
LLCVTSGIEIMPQSKKKTPSSRQANKLLMTQSEKRQQIAESVKFRDDLLKSQQRANYINEYDSKINERRRIRGLQSSILETRQTKLTELANISSHGKKHEIDKQKRQRQQDATLDLQNMNLNKSY